MGSIKLALINIIKNIKNEKELKSAFLIQIFGMAINNISFVILWYYFGKTIGEINGWTAMDIFGLYAYSTISYGVINSIFAGLYDIPKFIATANLDKYLLTPKNILLKICASRFRTSAVGDLLFGVVCYIVFAFNIHMGVIDHLLSLYFVILTCIVYFGFSLVCMSISFYLLDGQNVSEGIYHTFLSNTLYHGGAFTGTLRFIFTYILPSLLVGAIPVELVKDFNLSKFIIITSLSVIWLIIGIISFNVSLKRYDSNNLFGFGA